MRYSLVAIIYIILLSDLAYGLAWNREHKGYYLLSQILLPSSYQSSSGTARLASTQSSYKVYLEYGLSSKWTLITDLTQAVHYGNITINAELPYRFQGGMPLSYQQYSGKIGLSYQIAKDNKNALSAQLFYKPRPFIHRPGEGRYIKNLEEVSLGLAQGMSAKLSDYANLYMEVGYAPSFYYNTNKYSPESTLTLGLNLNNGWNVEVGLCHKMGAHDIKQVPYSITPDNMPYRFGYVAHDVNDLIKVASYHHTTLAQLAVGFQLNSTHRIVAGVHRHITSAHVPSKTLYSLGYVISN